MSFHSSDKSGPKCDKFVEEDSKKKADPLAEIDQEEESDGTEDPEWDAIQTAQQLRLASASK